jgi:small-conductance mechanosensitive channel
MDFEAITKTLELGFFTSNPYQAFINASLTYFLIQVFIFITCFVALTYFCKKSAETLQKKYPAKDLVVQLMNHVLPYLIFTSLASALIYFVSEANQPKQFLFSKEFTAVIGLIGLVKFCTWILRDVMKPHNLLSFLLGIMEWALFGIIALSSLGLYGTVIDSIAGIQFKIGELVLKGSNIFGGSIFALVAYTVAGQTARFIDIALDRCSKKHDVAANDLMVMSRAFRVIIFTVVSISVLMSLGIEGTQLVAFAGALGIGLGFGLQEVAVNLISGLYILFEGSLKLGDYVTINGVSGRVADLNSRSTVIEDEDGVRNLIPNSMITKEVLKSHPLNSDSYRFTFPVTLHILDDFLQAKALILGELKKHSHILDDKPQEVFVKSVNEESTKLEVSCWLNNIDRNPRQLLSDLYFGIAMALKAQGIRFSCNDELDASDDQPTH